MDVIIYHNPLCGTSRNTLAMIREAGIEPRIVEYLKTPLERDGLADLVERMGVAPRELLREKEAKCAELGLDHASVSDDALLDAMAEHPILMNRPVVVTDHGARLCRPAETVRGLLQRVSPIR